ncbi:MAG TPA: transglutaminase family protein [Geminicoccaceae bacterium]|nr:transglutaminase family protein [Geminicoccus sp.]HMU49419.1 transglutaminase family protein [Geminicoccaceae bacterium]
MRFQVGCELAYEARGAASLVMNIEAAKLARQRILRESLTITPDVPIERYTAPESGNRYLRFAVKGGGIAVRYEAEVELDPHRADPATIDETPVGELPFETLPHLWPSRYSQSDRLLRSARADFGHLGDGHQRVTALANWIHEHLEYERGSSNEHTSAVDTLVERAGVCRDFSNLGIALCRALGIPARFVSAYAWRLDPPDFHAVLEAYLGGRWYLFDATRQAALDGLVRIGIGRDASDVAFCTWDGEVEAGPMKVWNRPTPGQSHPEEPTVDAISLSEI